MVILSGGNVQNIYFDNQESSYFSGIDVSESAGVKCNYTRNIDVASIIANLTGLPVADVINKLNNLSIVDFNSVLNKIANIYINAENIQYLVEKNIGYVVLGLLKSADDNLFWGLVTNIYATFGCNLTFPEDNFYYMFGKKAGDSIFLAAFLKAASYTDGDAAALLFAAGSMAISGLLLLDTGVGFVVCESVALVDLVKVVGIAAALFVVESFIGGFVAHSTDLLKSDAAKLNEISEKTKRVSNPNEIKNVEIIDKNEVPLGELDGVDLEKGIIYEDKTVKGLDIINPKTGKPQQTAEQWAEKQILKKTETRINNLNDAVDTKMPGGTSLEAGKEIPTINQIKDLKNFVFRLEGDSPELREAMQNVIDKLSNEFPSYSFDVTYM